MAFDAQHGVNVAECLDLADFLERLPPEQFDMDREVLKPRSCGTACCIGGWINERCGTRLSITDAAKAVLGLSRVAATKLCWPGSSSWAYRATNVQAARVLRHLAATGEVDWSVALEAPSHD